MILKRLKQFLAKKIGGAGLEPSQVEQRENLLPEDLTFDSDRPIQDEKHDLLGFGAIASNLTTSILSGSTAEGLVIGIEGAWGSGKSSILNLIAEHIVNNEQVTLIKFSPWLIGSRDQMVAGLFADLISAIEQLPKNSSRRKAQKTKRLLKNLKHYGGALSRVASPLLGVAATFSKAGEIAQKANDAAGAWLGKTKQLSQLKDELVIGLRELNHRFIISIDDIDRLEPQEVNEIVRVIRAVGDFPNVIYLLCYDKDILATSLETALNIDSGKDYLQKIVQVSFTVPAPEEFDLRRWFKEECEKLYLAVNRTTLPHSLQERFMAVCDGFGGTIETPREVRLVINSMRLLYPPVADKVDFVDVCFLQLVRSLNDTLYKWIEQYLSIFAAVQNGAMVTDEERKRLGVELQNLMPSEDVASTKCVWALTSYILGLEAGHRKDPEKSVFNSVSGKMLSESENLKRLSSPQHYRFYFSFSRPSGALDDALIESILSAATQGDSLMPLLENLVKSTRPQGGTMFEVFLDRLYRSDLRPRSNKTLKNLMLSMVDVLDDANRYEREPGFFQTKSVWRNAKDLLRGVLGRLKASERKAFLKKLFSEGGSIGWLMAEVVGGDLFDHGEVGNKPIPSESRTLTSAELAEAKKILLKRLRGSDRVKIQSVPQPLSFFYRWQQAGGSDDIKAWVAEQSRTDRGFLRVLHQLRGWSASDKVYHPLNKRDVKHFMDYEEVIKRLNEIVIKKGPSEDVQLAKELIAAAAMGKDEI